MSEFPEHDKLSQVTELSQTIGEFLDWASDQRGVKLCVWRTFGGEYSDRYMPHGDFHELLAEFFDIDLKRLEEEKRIMLARLRGTDGS